MTADYCFSHANEYLTAIIPLFSNSKNNSPQCMSTQSKLYRSARKREAREKLMRYSEDQLLSIFLSYNFSNSFLHCLLSTKFSHFRNKLFSTIQLWSCGLVPSRYFKSVFGGKRRLRIRLRRARETESVARELCKWKIYWADAGAMKD